MNIAKDEAKAKDRAVQAAIAAQAMALEEADRTAQLLERLTNSERTKRAFLTGDIEAIRQLADAAPKPPAMQFGASKKTSGWKTSDGKSVYRYELYPTPESLAGALASATQISYYMAHETFREKLLTAGPTNGFTASYQGWGCLPLSMSWSNTQIPKTAGCHLLRHVHCGRPIAGELAEWAAQSEADGSRGRQRFKRPSHLFRMIMV